MHGANMKIINQIIICHYNQSGKSVKEEIDFSENLISAIPTVATNLAIQATVKSGEVYCNALSWKGSQNGLKLGRNLKRYLPNTSFDSLATDLRFCIPK